MMNLRKKDYVISFSIFFVILVGSIFDGDGEGIISPLIKSFFAALVLAVFIGTITNLIFKRKK